MNNEQSNPQQPASASQNGVNAELQIECERLRRLVQKLEEQQQQDRDLLEAVARERDEYRQLVQAWAREQFTEAELKNVPDEKDCVPLDQFLDELEQVVRQGETGRVP
jgi:hypothetical protein